VVISTRFELSAPIETAWAYLLDVQKVANCVPGGSLTNVVDDHTYDGKIEIRLGPIAVGYRGRVTLQNIDVAAHRLQIKAQGVESRGRGGASSTTTAELTENGAGTSVVMNTELQVSGVVAQFGRSGIMQEVAQRLTQRFGSCVEQQLKAAATAG
jgi:carbon monoxide dehydrogenase subunit G